MADLVGQIIGQYQITERLGRGGMADVYKAFHPGLAVYRALKVIRREFVTETGFQQRFQQEAQAVASLRHPNIVQMHDFGVQDELYYMVMEFIEGQDLKTYLFKQGQLRPFNRVVTIIEQIALALGYAHQRGVIHRDIKPANIMLTTDGQVILTDFGIAKMVTQTERMTQTGVGIGTPAYMSPEQARGLPNVGPPADIYSLGIVLYEMLVGQVPFSADTPLAVMLKVVSDPLPPPRDFSPDIPETLQGVVLKATAKDPAQRYQTTEALIDSLKRSLNLTAGATPPTEGLPDDGQATRLAVAAPTTAAVIPPKAEKAQPQGKPWLLIGAALAVVLCLLFTAAAGLFYFMCCPAPALVTQSTAGLPDTPAEDTPTENTSTEDTATQAPNAPFTGEGDIPLGQVIAGEITTSGQAAQYTFAGQAGQNIYFQFESASEGTYFSLLGPDGRTELFNVYNSSQGPVALDQAGLYTLIVTPDGPTKPQYAFTIWDLNPPVIDGGNLEFGQFIDGQINTPGQTAQYTFEGQAGQSIYFQFESASEGTYFSLIGPDSRTELFNVYNSNQGPVALEQAGPYTLIVTPDGPTTPQYTFAIWDVNPPVIDGGTIAFGQFIDGQINTPGQTAQYTFEGQVGQNIYFQFESASAGAYFSLIGPDGHTELFNVYNSNQGPVALDQAGSYTLIVTPDSPTKLEFAFAIWDVNPPVIDGGNIEFGQFMDGQINTPGQTAQYTFEGQASQNIYFQFESASAGAYFSLLGPDGRTELFNVYNSNQGPIALEQAGPYTLIVTPDGPTKLQYAFAIWDVNPPVIDGGTIAFGQFIDGQINTPGQTAQYTFEGQAGQSINFQFESASEGAYFSLIGPDGHTELFNVYNSNQGPVVLDEAGSYTLIVTPDGPAKPKYTFVINLE